MAEINDNLRIASKADLKALTAADVHARPDTWMPTASDVGAVPINQPVTDELWFANKLARIIANGSTFQIELRKAVGDTANRRFINIAHVDSNPTNKAISWSEILDGKQTKYMLLGEHNMKDYVLPLDGSVPMSGELKYFDGSKTLAYPVPMANAGFHNSIYRGKSLGSAVTDAQWAAIKAGTFDDLFIGDYWTIGGVTYRIAAFDYYYKTGDTSCETHHVTLVPDTSMYTHVMNDTNITDGAYVGSKMYTTGLTQAKTTINNAFGSAHILNHRQYLQNATTNGVSTGGAWYDSTIELMTEQNVYGCKIFGDVVHGTTFQNNYTIDKSQYPLFAFRPDMISNRQWFWLRDVANATRFAYVNIYGYAGHYNASSVCGVRPAFSIVS